MRNRWIILALLCVARPTMAFQFKALPRSQGYWAASSALLSLIPNADRPVFYANPCAGIAGLCDRAKFRRQDHYSWALILMLIDTVAMAAFRFLNRPAESGVNAAASPNRC